MELTLNLKELEEVVENFTNIAVVFDSINIKTHEKHAHSIVEDNKFEKKDINDIILKFKVLGSD